MKPSPSFLPPFPSFVNLSLSLSPSDSCSSHSLERWKIRSQKRDSNSSNTGDPKCHNWRFIFHVILFLRNKLQNDPSLTRDGLTRGILRRKETELTGEFASNPPTVERKMIKEEKGWEEEENMWIATANPLLLFPANWATITLSWSSSTSRVVHHAVHEIKLRAPR